MYSSSCINILELRRFVYELNQYLLIENKEEKNHNTIDGKTSNLQYLLSYKQSQLHFEVLLFQSLHNIVLLYNIYLKNYNIRQNEPSKETKPHETQIIKHKPIDCVSRKTPFGETNIPEPINKTLIILNKINRHLFFTNNYPNNKTNT